jgi:hypothetical protein
MCNYNFSIHYKEWWPKFYKKNTISVQSYGKAVSGTQKVNFSISWHYTREYSSQRPREVITRVFINDFITISFRLLSVPNKIPDLQNDEAFPNVMCPINVKKMDDIKQVMKYVDHDHHEFWTCILAWETAGKEDQDK